MPTTLVRKVKRQLAMVALAFSDISKSALANQKSIGLDGAAQAISVSVLSETKQTLNDMLRGRQTQQTQQLAAGWWKAHIAWQRGGWVTEEVNGVMTHYKRELTDEEWRQKIEKLALVENTALGPVVLLHEIKRTYSDNAALVYAEDGRVLLNEVVQDQGLTTNFELTTDPGFYFPVDTLDHFFVRCDAENQFHLEFHSTLHPMEQVEYRSLDGGTSYESKLTSDPYDKAGADYQVAPQLEAGNVSYQMAVDPAYRYLLRGLRRVALVQEEYSGLVIRAFTLGGEPRIGHHQGHLVLTYPAMEALVTAQETKKLNGEG